METGPKVTFLNHWFIASGIVLAVMSMVAAGLVLGVNTMEPSGFGVEKRPLAEDTNKLSPTFFVNDRSGEDDSYLFRGPSYAARFERSKVSYLFAPKSPGRDAAPENADGLGGNTPEGTKTWALTVSFGEAGSKVPVTAEGRLDFPVNRYSGSDKATWRADDHAYRRIRYKNLYPGIDLVFKSDSDRLKYEYIVKPGADYQKIQLIYQGMEGLEIDRRGDLVIKTPDGIVKDEKPAVYQVIEGRRTAVAGGFKLQNGTVGFSLGRHNRAYPVIIDPGLIYSGFTGSSGGDISNKIAVDGGGNAYVVGYTWGANFPTTPGSADTTFSGVYDAYVVKIDATGNHVLYATYLGGSAHENGHDIAVDPAGNAYISGVTYSADFPVTAGAYDSSFGGQYDGYVTKLDPDGRLSYSTYLGGAGKDQAPGITVDNSGTAFIAGLTDTTDFATTPGVFDQTYNGGTDAFVVALNPTGTSLNWSTFLGGTSLEICGKIALDPVGNVYVTGLNYSYSNFPTSPGAYDRTASGVDTFVTKFSSTGQMVYSTLLGGWGADLGNDLAVDEEGGAYVVGKTEAADFPTTSNAVDATKSGGWGQYDVFVTKLNPSGGSLDYSTYLGDEGYQSGAGIAVDDLGNIYLAGDTTSSAFPATAGAFDQSYNGSTDAFLIKLSADGSLAYSSFLGGTGPDIANGLALDTRGDVYVTGHTGSWHWQTGYPFPSTTGSFDPTHNGDWDGWVAKLGVWPKTTATITPPEPDGDTGWYKTAPLVSFSADEPGLTYWQWDATSTDGWQAYSESISWLEGEHTLYYRSIDPQDNAEPIRDLFFKSDTAAPTAPVLSAVADSTSQINLTWTSSSDALSGLVGYLLYDADTGEAIVSVDGTSYNDIGLAPDTQRRYFVEARDAAGNLSEPSNTAAAATQPLIKTTNLVYTGGLSGDYSDPVVLSAILVDADGGPVIDRLVRFNIGGQEAIATTDLLGVAQIAMTLNQPPGTYNLSVQFAGDDAYAGSVAQTDFEIKRETAQLDYTGDTITQRYQTANLKAQLFEVDSFVGDLSGKTVVFTISDGLNSQQVSAQTDAAGNAQTTVAITQPAGLYSVAASVTGDSHYLDVDTPAVPYVVWEAIPGLNINGGGWLTKEGQKANFGFTAKYIANNPAPVGQLQFQDRSSGQTIHSDGLDWLVVTSDSLALLQGSSNINGQGGHSFRIVVSDVATPGKGSDTFELQIDGLTLISGVLDGGNIITH